MAYSKTILVVEDDAFIRMALVDAMADEGFDVLDVSNALEAIAVLGQDQRVDAMVTDVDMPGPLNGLHLATMAARVFPAMLTAVSSGRHEVAAQLSEGALFFPKPCSGSIIARRMRDLLVDHERIAGVA
jgi:DNA-binding response OmpR family regulator